LLLIFSLRTGTHLKRKAQLGFKLIFVFLVLLHLVLLTLPFPVHSKAHKKKQKQKTITEYLTGVKSKSLNPIELNLNPV